MFSMQQLLGKHLLMILLTIALGGAISIAAVPSLRGPVTDYFSENFGPKADVITKSNNCSTTPPATDYKGTDLINFKTSKSIVEIGDIITATLTHSVPAVWQEYWQNTCAGCIPYQYWKHSGLSDINIYANDQSAISDVRLNNGENKSNFESQLLDTRCNNCNDGLLQPGDYTVSFKIKKPTNSIDSTMWSNGWSYLGYQVYGDTPLGYNKLFPSYGWMPYCSFCDSPIVVSISPVLGTDANNKLLIKTTYNGKPVSADVNVGYYKEVNDTTKGKYFSLYSSRTVSTGDDSTAIHEVKRSYPGPMKIDFKSSWKCIKPATSVEYIIPELTLNIVDPNDETVTKRFAKANGNDKIKVKVVLKNTDGSLNTAQNVEVYSNGGKLSMTGEDDKFVSYTKDSTLSLLGNRDFYILDEKAETVAISAKSLDQNGMAIANSVNVEFREPILTHEVDKTEADSNGKDTIKYTLTAYSTDGKILPDQKIKASFIISKGWIEYSQDNGFTSDSTIKVSALKNENGEILSDPQITQYFISDKNGQVILYLRSKDFTQAKLTGLLKFANRDLGTNDKSFKDIAFKGARISMVSNLDEIEANTDDYATITAIVKDKDNNPITDNQVLIELKFDPEALLKLCQTALFDEKGTLGKWQDYSEKIKLTTDKNGQIQFAYRGTVAGSVTINALTTIKDDNSATDKELKSEPVKIKSNAVFTLLEIDKVKPGPRRDEYGFTILDLDSILESGELNYINPTKQFISSLLVSKARAEESPSTQTTSENCSTCIDIKSIERGVYNSNQITYSLELDNQTSKKLDKALVGIRIDPKIAKFVDLDKKEQTTLQNLNIEKSYRGEIYWNVDILLEKSKTSTYKFTIEIINKDKSIKAVEVKSFFKTGVDKKEHDGATKSTDLASLDKPKLQTLAVGRISSDQNGNKSLVVYTRDDYSTWQDDIKTMVKDKFASVIDKIDYQLVSKESNEFLTTLPGDILYNILEYTNTGKDFEENKFELQTIIPKDSSKLTDTNGWRSPIVKINGQPKDYKLVLDEIPADFSDTWVLKEKIKTNDNIKILYDFKLNDNIKGDVKKVTSSASIRDKSLKTLVKSNVNERDLSGHIKGQISIDGQAIPRVLVNPLNGTGKPLSNFTPDNIQNFYADDNGNFDILYNRGKDFADSDKVKFQVIFDSKLGTTNKKDNDDNRYKYTNQDNFEAGDRGVEIYFTDSNKMNLITKSFDLPDTNSAVFKLSGSITDSSSKSAGVGFLSSLTSDGQNPSPVDGIEYPKEKTLLEQLGTGMEIYQNIFKARRVIAGKESESRIIPLKLLLKNKISLTNNNNIGSYDYNKDEMFFGTKTWEPKLNRSSQTEFHEFGHFIEDDCFSLFQPSVSIRDDKIPYKLINNKHWGYLNDSTSDSLSEGFAGFIAVFLDININKKDPYDNDSWNIITESANNNAKIIANLNVIYPISPLIRLKIPTDYTEVLVPDRPKLDSVLLEEIGIAEIFKELVFGYREQMSLIKNNWISEYGDITEFNYKSKDDLTLNKRIDNLLKGFRVKSVSSLKDVYDNLQGIVEYPKKDYDNIFIAHGAFHDQNCNGAYNVGEPIGEIAQDNGFRYSIKDTTNADLVKTMSGIIGPRYWRNMMPPLLGSDMLVNLTDSNGQPVENTDLIISTVFDPEYINYNNTQRITLDNNSQFYLNTPLSTYGKVSKVVIIPKNSSLSSYVFPVDTIQKMSSSGVVQNISLLSFVIDNQNGLKPPQTLEGALANYTAQQDQIAKDRQAADLQAQIAELEKQLAQARTDQAQAEADKKKAQETATAALKAKEEAQAKAQAEEQARLKSEADLAAAQAKIIEQEKEITRLKAVIADLESQLAQFRIEAESAKKEYQAKIDALVKSQNEQLTLVQNEYNTAKDKLLADYSTLLDQKQELVKAQEDLKKSQAEQDKKITDLTKQLDDKDTRINDLTAKLNEATTKVNEQNNKINSLQEEYDNQLASGQTLQATIKYLEIQLVQAQALIINYQKNSLERQLANEDYQSKYLETQLALIKSQDQVKEIADKYLANQKLIKDLKNKIQDLESKVKDFQDQVTLYQSQLEDLNTKLNDSYQREAGLTNQNTDLKAKLASSTSIWDKLKLEYDLAINSYQLKLTQANQANLLKDQKLLQAKLDKAKLELANQLLEQKLKEKEQELLLAQQKETQDELNNQTTTQEDLTQTNSSLLEEEISKKDEDLVNKENELKKEETNLTNPTDNDKDDIIQAPTIILSSQLEDSTNNQTIKSIKDLSQATLANVEITSSTNENNLPIVTTNTVNQETPKINTQKDELIIDAKNFTIAEEVKVLIDDQEVASTPIVSGDLTIKVPNEKLTDLSLGDHTVTIKDDLGNVASTDFKVSENNVWNTDNLGMGATGFLALVIIGYVIMVVTKGSGLVNLPFVSIIMTIGFSVTILMYLLSPQSIFADNRSFMERQSLNRDTMENVNGFIRMPDSSGHYYSNVIKNNLNWEQKWAKPETICFVQRLAKEWYNKGNTNNPLQIGKLSNADGKEIYSGSAKGYEYQGLGVDIRDNEGFVVLDDIDGNKHNYIKEKEFTDLIKEVASQFKFTPDIKNIPGYIHIKLNK